MKRILTAALIASLPATTGVAAVYDCRMSKNDPSGWVPERVVVNYRAGSDQVTVNDPIIQHFVGQPITGEVDVDNSKRVTFKWTVQSTNRTAQFAKMAYRMTMRKGSNAVSISGKPLGYVNNYRSSGVCKVRG
jgi:hypothetical protein